MIEDLTTDDLVVIRDTPVKIKRKRNNGN